MSVFDTIAMKKIKDGLTKTREGLLGKVTRLVTAKAVVDDDVLEKVEEALIAADVGVDNTMQIMEAIRARVKVDRYRDAAELEHLLRDEIRRQFSDDRLQQGSDVSLLSESRPYVIMIVGVNGVGKTTTIGKLAHNYRRQGYSVTIAAADTFRAAANEQLDIWAQRSGASIIRQQPGADPAAVAFDAVKSATAQGTNVVIIDTAGRLHTKVNLMEELKKIKRVLSKQDSHVPHEVLLVIDASTGQNGLQQARAFGKAVDITGLVLTKLDGTAKGGIVLAISRALNVPIRFIGVGEQIDDLQPFNREIFVDALFAPDTTG
jgi:fused signal recognition particle receptor